MALLKYILIALMVRLELPFLPQRPLDLLVVVNRAAIEETNEDVLKGHTTEGLGAKRWIALS